MKPLAVHGGAAGTLFWLSAGGWAAFELVLAIRTRGGGEQGRDRSFVPLTLTVLGGLALAVLAARRAGDLALPGPGWWPVALGLSVFAAGIALRAWAVHELGRFFKFTVVVQTDHRVVDTGPYRRIRHPSYTGLLTASLGLGIALGTWLSIPACVLPPLVGFSIRLLTEERVLARELGEPYRYYMRRTWRLVPGLW
jgi:protein-S-isoprenylcysteine O-methyltransferase Ste14